jgi:FKBP-type peptidyl-prolyl cis-trans isomerase
MIRLRYLLALAALLLAPLAHAQGEKFTPDDLEFIAKTWPNAKRTNTGIRYIIEKPGNGPLPQPGNIVGVLYTGSFLDGKVFDKNQDAKNPFTFRVRRGVVIEAWEQILPLMHLGEKRLIIVPSEYGYGTRGQGPTIPPDATLVFEIELISCKAD